jgi:hypothetical protein
VRLRSRSPSGEDGAELERLRKSLREYRPHAKVLATILGALEKEIDRVVPHLLICEPPVPENPGGKVAAWIELSIDPNRLSSFRVGQ